jgi:surface antigen
VSRGNLFQAGQKAEPELRYSAAGAPRNRSAVALGFGWLLLAPMLGACSLTMHLAAFKEEPETTASIANPAAALDPALDQEDWRRAQAALSLAVDPQGSGQPVNWDNPSSKRRGSFMPAGDLVLSEGTVCRAFTATIVETRPQPKETRRTGRACRIGPSEWALRTPTEVQPASLAATAGKPAPAPFALTPGTPPASPMPSPSGAMLEARSEANSEAGEP